MAYNWLPVLDMAGRLLREALWAPALIVLACTTALAWEIGEFAVDQVTGSALQQGNFDTMSDLILGVAGAVAYLAFHALSQAAARGAR